MTESDNARIHQKPDPERQRQAGEYARIRRYLGGTDLALVAIVLVVVVFGGLSARLAGDVSLPAVAAAVIYLIILVAAYGLLSAPLGYYRGFVLPRRYGLSHQSLTDWLADLLKAGALAAALACGMVAAIYWLMTVLPGAWWLAAWGLVVLVSLVLSVLAPVIIIPIFFKMKPLADGELRQRLERLAKRAGVAVGGIYARRPGLDVEIIVRSARNFVRTVGVDELGVGVDVPPAVGEAAYLIDVAVADRAGR